MDHYAYLIHFKFVPRDFIQDHFKINSRFIIMTPTYVPTTHYGPPPTSSPLITSRNYQITITSKSTSHKLNSEKRHSNNPRHRPHGNHNPPITLNPSTRTRRTRRGHGPSGTGTCSGTRGATGGRGRRGIEERSETGELDRWICGVADSLGGGFGGVLVCCGAVCFDAGGYGGEELVCYAEAVDLDEVLA